MVECIRDWIGMLLFCDYYYRDSIVDLVEVKVLFKEVVILSFVIFDFFKGIRRFWKVKLYCVKVKI